ncbi:single-stranded-DNA-specific exonuclease RecJ [Lapidilactobacillus luobeiensis]|uniref:single-stranded-DNA-specific exonuclease RecJ n=1 Tax=Lapidilactobacillus luobeiensis TaxID=2950371 RepID=UPI0021C49F5A|nr:single-stranded-DNA-specific exonuclease RecJ [Lapidilactobacillus luobeiensis]
MQDKWTAPKQFDHDQITTLAQSLGLAPLIVAILMNRGLTTAEQIRDFLAVDLSDLTTPDHFHDLDKAVARIEQALENNEKIVIYGDYDADGVTSVAILVDAFSTLGVDVDYYVPSRFTDGYGPNLARYQELVEQGTQLLITVDNGITGVAEVAYAQAQGMDVIITDHHDLPEQLPQAYAIVHPRHPKSTCDFGFFSGAGVAFYLAWGLLGELPSESLDLAMIGTVGDVMPLVADNRVIVAAGLQQLQGDPRLGLAALAEQAKIDLTKVTARDLAFSLIPRLNSLGRVGSARPAVALLTTFAESEAKKIAQEVEQVNQQRQTLVQAVLSQATEQIETGSRPAALVVAGVDWAEGVLGIVASRLVDTYHCPTLVLSIDQKTGVAKGSGRSVGEFDLFKALDRYREHFQKFGGHAGAVGLSLAPTEIAGLRTHLVAQAQSQLSAITATAGLVADYRLSASELAALTPETVIQLEQVLGPFGEKNPQPLFELIDLPWQQWQAIGQTQQTLKGTLTNQIEAVAFREGDQAAKLRQAGQQLAILGTLGTNTWRGKTKLQITVCGAHPTGTDLAQTTKASSLSATTPKVTKKGSQTTTPVSPVATPTAEPASARSVTASANPTVKVNPDAIANFATAQWRWPQQDFQVIDCRHQRLGPKMLQHPWSYICFDQRLGQRLQQQHQQVRFILHPDQLLPNMAATVFIDLPSSVDQLQTYLKILQTPRLYLLFYTSQQRQEQLRLQIPQLRALLKEIYRQPEIKRPQLSRFADHCQLTTAQLDFGIRVFSELNFVKMDKERLVANRQAEKQPLTASATFQRQQAMQLAYQQLALGSLQQVDAFIKQA